MACDRRSNIIMTSWVEPTFAGSTQLYHDIIYINFISAIAKKKMTRRTREPPNRLGVASFLISTVIEVYTARSAYIY